MIEFTKAYVVGEKVFATLNEAQIHELESIFKDFPVVDNPVWTPKGVALRIVECSDQVQDVLSMTPTSKPRARAIHGGRKVRKTKVAEANDGENKPEDSPGVTVAGSGKYRGK